MVQPLLELAVAEVDQVQDMAPSEEAKAVQVVEAQAALRVSQAVTHLKTAQVIQVAAAVAQSVTAVKTVVAN